MRIYIGCCPNNAATLFAISPLVASDQRLRLVANERDGPTTTGDNLSRMWAALGADERAEGLRFATIVLHDAEDHVHAGEIALYRRHLNDAAMVQIPVVLIIARGARWTGGHYGDEFAEAHGKEMVVRSLLGIPLPSAGVGDVALPHGFRLEAYGQAGIVGARRRDGFADGAIVIDRPVGTDESSPLRRVGGGRRAAGRGARRCRTAHDAAPA